MSPILDSIGSVKGFGWGAFSAAGGDYESIATVNVGAGGTSTVSFSSIPSTYTHLQIRHSTRCSRADYTVAAMYLRFNSDSNTNYTGHVMGTDGINLFVYGGQSYTFAYSGLSSGTNSGSNVFSAGVVDILDYANTNKYKTTSVLSGFDRNATGSEVNFQAASWRSTSAISSIDITLENNSNFLQHSKVALYGIRG